MSEAGAPTGTGELGHRLVRADAGTGKTYSLALRFLSLLGTGAQPRSILAATFTRKAAGEILERILVPPRFDSQQIDPNSVVRISAAGKFLQSILGPNLNQRLALSTHSRPGLEGR